MDLPKKYCFENSLLVKIGYMVFWITIFVVLLIGIYLNWDIVLHIYLFQTIIISVSITYLIINAICWLFNIIVISDETIIIKKPFHSIINLKVNDILGFFGKITYNNTRYSFTGNPFYTLGIYTLTNHYMVRIDDDDMAKYMEKVLKEKEITIIKNIENYMQINEISINRSFHCCPR